MPSNKVTNDVSPLVNVITVYPRLAPFRSRALKMFCSEITTKLNWQADRDSLVLFSYHDDVMTRKRFLRYCTFIREIHRSPVETLHQGPVMLSFGFSFVVFLEKRSFMWFSHAMTLMWCRSNEQRFGIESIHWGGRGTHICVNKLNIIASDNDLSPCRCQDIIWTNVGIL